MDLPPRLRQLLTWSGLAALLLVAVVTAGWDDPAPDRRPVAPDPAPVPSVDLAGVALVRTDLPGFTVASDRYGRELDGDPGRDVCGRVLAGDSRRRAARELVLTGDGRRVTAQVAAYERGGAAAVLRQVRAAATACPRGPAPHRLRGIQSLDRRYALVETPGSVSVLATVTDRAGHRRRSEVVYQRRGDVLSVLGVDPVEGRDDPLVRRTTSVLAARLDRSATASIG